MEETNYYFSFLFHSGWFVNSFITRPAVARQLVSHSATSEIEGME